MNPGRRATRTHPAQDLADQTRHIHARWCRSCKAPVLRGLHDLRCAFDIEVDPGPLSALGEALALLAGRRTFSCEVYSGLRFTGCRDASRITSRPAGTRRLDVYASHLCGATPLPSIPSNFTKPVVDLDDDSPCPF